MKKMKGVTGSYGRRSMTLNFHVKSADITQ